MSLNKLIESFEKVALARQPIGPLPQPKPKLVKKTLPVSMPVAPRNPKLAPMPRPDKDTPLGKIKLKPIHSSRYKWMRNPTSAPGFNEKITRDSRRTTAVTL